MDEKIRKPIAAGVFSHDDFPFMVIHKIYSVDDDGRLNIGGCWITGESLIIIFPVKKSEAVQSYLYSLEDRRRKQIKSLTNSLLIELSLKFPSLGKKVREVREINDMIDEE